MKAVTPYLIFNGDADEAFTFYQSVLGGELNITRFGDMAGGEDMPDDAKNMVANVALQLAGEAQALMASDAPPGQEAEIGTNARYFVTLEVESRDEAERIFGAFSEGGEVIMPLDRTEWAELFAMFTDRYSVQWMINFEGDAEMAG